MVRAAEQLRRQGYSLAALVLLAPASLALAADDGSALYAQYCGRCHDSGAEGAPAPDDLAQMSKADILQALESGKMKAQGSRRTPEERATLAAFLSGDNAAAAAAPAGAAPAAGAPAGAAASAAAAPAPNRRPPPPPPGPPPQNRCTFRPSIDLSDPHYNTWGASITNERSESAADAGLSAADVPKLRLKWAFGFPGADSAAAQPTVIGRWVFVSSSSGRIYAIDLLEGCVFWTFDAEKTLRTSVTIAPIPRTETGGSHYAAYISDSSANVYSLNPMTGELRWKRHVGGPRARNSASPSVYNGRVYVPLTASGDEDSRDREHGAVAALDADTGAPLWMSSTLQKPSEPGKGPNGVAVWNTPTIDAKLGRLYVGTGDSHASPAGPTSDSILAYDLKTGAMVWAYQSTKEDAYIDNCDQPLLKDCPAENGGDVDFGEPPALVTLENGKRLLVAGQKDGMVSAIDPDNKGKEVWRARAGHGSALGGMMWGVATDGHNVYVPVGDHLGLVDRYVIEPNGGALVALRLSDGKELWRTKAPSGCPEHEGINQQDHLHLNPDNVTGRAPTYFGCANALNAPTTLIPGVAFSGSLDGHLRAYATGDGKVLWDFDTARDFLTVNFVDAHGGSIDHGGVAVVSGIVLTTSGYTSWGGMHGNVLLAFSAEDAK